ncbi:MAG: aldo/keto reductase [Candidatus Micrarchaeota archaeon]|nr:aldo/keto reductase [Candidatus Micrarchaeota archaeon]
MEYKPLGKTGEKIPVVGLGTWQSNRNEAESLAALRYGIRKGIRFVDTAEMYGTEEMVGSALKGHKGVFLATKVSPHHFRYDDVIRSCDASLKALGVKQIDLYQLHWPNRRVPISETMAAMEKLVDDGKIRHIGVSNFSVKELVEAQESMKRYEIVSNQVEYSVLVRDVENELLAYCEANGVTMIAYSPYANGSLFKEKYSGMLELLDGIGKAYGKSGAQVALNWLLAKNPVVAIPKASSVAHVDTMLGSIGWGLGIEDIEKIDNIEGFSKRSLAESLGFILKNTSIWAGVATKHYHGLGKKSR